MTPLWLLLPLAPVAMIWNDVDDMGTLPYSFNAVQRGAAVMLNEILTNMPAAPLLLFAIGGVVVLGALAFFRRL